jgi:formylmethanofuran dehydrogenase subunit E
MPLGFRAGVAALEALGAERELNMAKLAFVETASGHAAGCFADGVQMATGCTFGKGLIERTQYGKWALTLVDRGTGKAVRVTIRPAVMQASFKSTFVEQRRQGTPPTEIALDITSPWWKSFSAAARMSCSRSPRYSTTRYRTHSSLLSLWSSAQGVARLSRRTRCG